MGWRRSSSDEGQPVRTLLVMLAVVVAAVTLVERSHHRRSYVRVLVDRRAPSRIVASSRTHTDERQTGAYPHTLRALGYDRRRHRIYDRPFTTCLHACRGASDAATVPVADLARIVVVDGDAPDRPRVVGSVTVRR